MEDKVSCCDFIKSLKPFIGLVFAFVNVLFKIHLIIKEMCHQRNRPGKPS